MTRREIDTLIAKLDQVIGPELDGPVLTYELDLPKARNIIRVWLRKQREKATKGRKR